MSVLDERLERVTSFIKAIAKTNLSAKRYVSFNVKFKDGVSPVLDVVVSQHQKLTHDDFKQLMTVCEDNDLKLTFENGVFTIL